MLNPEKYYSLELAKTVFVIVLQKSLSDLQSAA